MPPFTRVPTAAITLYKRQRLQREREIGEPLVFTHRPPLFLRPTATDGDDPILPDPRRTDGCAARLAEAIHASTESCVGQRGQREGLDGWSHNELGLETTLGSDDPILIRQSHEDDFKI